MEELRYDPFDYGIDLRAHDVWKRLRDEAPLYRNDEHDFWAVSRYDDVLAGLLDVDTYLSRYGTVLDLMGEDEFPLPMFIFRDPPEHTLLRKLVSRAFTPRKIEDLERRIAQICDDLLAPLEGQSTVDYVDAFAAVLPPTVILALLGFPAGLEQSLRQSMDAALAVDEGATASSTSELVDGSGNVGSAVYAMLPELCRERRAAPQDDLLTVLATHERELPDGSTRLLEPDEINCYVALISGAGAETVARLLGWAAVLLARHPDQRAELRADEALIPGAVEEILRYEAPSPVQGRRLARSVEIHGQTVPAGANILLLNGSGNRDERHFPDPDRFDIHRRIDRHLSFGYGAHFCIGAALARLEGRVALQATLARFGDWEVDESEVDWVHTSTVRGYASVPIHV
ncbi:MAG: cytochrome P450 [Acidimicrobiia bacterium]|nr:cytochrome P450 [Acidimicrobiia bacterium]MDH5236221.1 cytochrome P450 [Acidimicrobiia bacterium]